MLNYKCLNKQVFEIDEYKIVPIRFEDRYDIMRWRNEQMYHLRQTKILTIEDQDLYFENSVLKLFDKINPDQILFSYLKNEICIGYGGVVHINWLDKNAELSFVINTEIEKQEFSQHWSIFLKLIEKVLFQELKFHKIYTHAFDLRPKLYSILETEGYKREAILKEHKFIDNKFVDIIIHSKFNYKK